ncbi:hypothetical protein GCM10017771_59730 [Streptomyces capitiformicae]|uniref:Uncharacterized protein n=1 Tax=Streptomyces capitiformicae TaxID=2014920 RepID=A0A919DGB1_9ACTN|nr:hypothetical protein GCM10017771_59730 [Streptomyces capitiformicae]
MQWSTATDHSPVHMPMREHMHGHVHEQMHVHEECSRGYRTGETYRAAFLFHRCPEVGGKRSAPGRRWDLPGAGWGVVRGW